MTSKLLMGTPAAGGAFVPPAGCVIWTRADDLALADAASVVTWSDQSGSGNNLTSSATSKRPTYRTGIINGLPVVRYDGVDDSSENTGISVATPHTIVILLQQANVNTTNRAVVDQTSAGDGEGFYRSNAAYIAEGGGSSINFGTIATINVAALVCVHNGASCRFYVNGGTPFTGALGADVMNGIRIAANRNNAAFSAMDVGEFFFFDSALSASALNDVGSYLERWGTTWTTAT